MVRMTQYCRNMTQLKYKLHIFFIFNQIDCFFEKYFTAKFLNFQFCLKGMIYGRPDPCQNPCKFRNLAICYHAKKILKKRKIYKNNRKSNKIMHCVEIF